MHFLSNYVIAKYSLKTKTASEESLQKNDDIFNLVFKNSYNVLQNIIFYQYIFAMLTVPLFSYVYVVAKKLHCQLTFTLHHTGKLLSQKRG